MVTLDTTGTLSVAGSVFQRHLLLPTWNPVPATHSHSFIPALLFSQSYTSLLTFPFFHSQCCCVFSSQRLSTATVPFTVISVAHNPCHEDFMVVCGLKASPPTPSLPHSLTHSLFFPPSLPPSPARPLQECQLLVLNSSAQVTSRAVLHPSVEPDGYIVKVSASFHHSCYIL